MTDSWLLYTMRVSCSACADWSRALQRHIDAGIPKATLNRDALAWRRWTDFCAGFPTQTWRLDRNSHSGADPVGFDRESRLLYAFLIYCYELIQPRSKTPKAAKPSSAFKMIRKRPTYQKYPDFFFPSTS